MTSHQKITLSILERFHDSRKCVLAPELRLVLKAEKMCLKAEKVRQKPLKVCQRVDKVLKAEKICLKAKKVRQKLNKYEKVCTSLL